MKSETMKSFLVYSSASYAVQILGIITSISIRHFLEPSSMGVWSLLDMMTKYGLYANLGVLTALNVELPICIGRGELEKAQKMRSSALVFAVLSSAAFSSLAAASVIFLKGLSSDQQIFIWLNCALLVVTTWYNYHISLMWAEKKFPLLSAGIISNALIYLFFVFIFIPRFHLLGLLGTGLLSMACAGMIMHAGLKIKIPFQIDWKVLGGLLKAGLPLMAVGFAYSFFTTVDRLLIARYLSTTQLGYYSIAILMLTYSITIPTLLSNVIFPSLLERYGKTGSKKDISGMVTKPVILLSYTMPIVLGLAYFGVPFLVKVFMHKYEPGIESMHLVLLGSFFISISQPIVNYLLTINKRLHTIPLMLVGTIVTVVTSIVFIRRGFGLNGIALGMSAGFFSFYTAMLFFAYGYFQHWKQSLLFYIESVFSFVYLVSIVWCISTSIKFKNLTCNCIAQNGLFLILCLPYLWLAERKTQAVSSLFRALTNFSLKRSSSV